MHYSQGFQGENQWYNLYEVSTEDTIIGSFSYNKLFLYNNYHGAYRNDDTARKIYYIPALDTSQTLLYDFSLGIGDTFIIPVNGVGCLDTIGIVSSIDSVLIGNDYRLRINFTQIVSCIAGIGSEVGLFQIHGFCFEYASGLICFKENDTIYYGDELGCSLATTIISNGQLSEPALVHPNPTTGLFTVQGATGEIQVYDLFGRLVLRTTEPQIDMSRFSKGLYFVKRVLNGVEGTAEATRKLVLH